MRPSAIKPHGGYQKLKSFQNSEVVYDLTVEFCKRYISPDRSYRTADQMVQAARSGKQNIAEGSKRSGVSKKSEFELTSVSRSSFEELKQDFIDFLRQNGLKLWDKDDARVKEVRQLAYRTNRSYKIYMSYMSNPEAAANMLVTLINQTNYLLDKQLQALEKDVPLTQNELYQARREQVRKGEENMKKFILKTSVRLIDGRFISREKYFTLKRQGKAPELFPGWGPDDG